MGSSSSLAELLSVILDKGIVIDAWARVSVVGIEILTIEARIVVASVETYLRYAEAIGLTALAAAPQGQQQGSARRDNGQRSRNNGAPSPEQIQGYLSDHPEGLRLGEMQAYFDAPRDQMGEAVNQLVEQRKARRDDQNQLYFAANEGR